MSSKGSKRRQRRINTHDEEPEKKLEQLVEQTDDSKQSNIITDTDKLDNTPGLTEENGPTEQQLTKEPEPITVQNGTDTSLEKESKDTKPDVAETTNSQTDSEITNSQSTDTSSDVQKSVDEDENSDIEPLVLDSEDTELLYPSETTSDRSSEIEKSPVLNRCQTRRSQTRNVPTPRTPKSLDFNGEAECKSEVRVNVTRLVAPEVIITPPTADVEDPPQENISFEATNNDETAEESEEDLANASVFVNFTGNDTRNLDITTTTLNDEPTGPSFLETTKDLSYGETLRCISGRKGLRQHFETSYKPRAFKSTMDLTSKDMTDAKKYTPSTGTKRKLNRDSPEEYKRAKTDGDTSGLMSFIQSPFKAKVGRTEIPSSTPKLTAFKYTPHQGSTIIDEVSKIDLELHHERSNTVTTEPKKWCSIM